MAGLCEGGNEPSGSLKAICKMGEERMMLKLIRKRKRNWLGRRLRRNCLLKDELEGMVNGRRVRGRRRYEMIDDIKIHGSYEEAQRKEENRKDWGKLDLHAQECFQGLRETPPPSSSAQEKTTTLVVQNPIILLDNARSHTAAAFNELLRRWQWEILEHPPYSPEMSRCNYHLYAKVKEPLSGALCNNRDELIFAIEQSIRNIKKHGRADDLSEKYKCIIRIRAIDVAQSPDSPELRSGLGWIPL
ncbi:hypothetical protein ANN_24827 [Periplaneta americana]|uniref:Tc1-like transposase DDE domain-containing protein n=1 Tax=Periplaneta americana TaxID=6978 RepID=A0ABQ8S014_PERAM|nr:hypothetical protein ANN_24827 [Periplaneta americana]